MSRARGIRESSPPRRDNAMPSVNVRLFPTGVTGNAPPYSTYGSSNASAYHVAGAPSSDASACISSAMASTPADATEMAFHSTMNCTLMVTVFNASMSFPPSSSPSSSSSLSTSASMPMSSSVRMQQVCGWFHSSHTTSVVATAPLSNANTYTITSFPSSSSACSDWILAVLGSSSHSSSSPSTPPTGGSFASISFSSRVK